MFQMRLVVLDLRCTCSAEANCRPRPWLITICSRYMSDDVNEAQPLIFKTKI